jgi:transcriptional regulator with XRE-family HTH domain
MKKINQSNEQHWKLLVLVLKKIATKKGITQAQIAERAGLIQSNVSRMFALKFPPTLKTFIAVARAIEVNFFFEDREDKTELNQIFEAAMTELGRRNQKNKN